MIGTLLIPPRFTGWDDVGDPIPGGLLHTYAAGTPSTNIPTYFDEDLATIHANANPIVLDAAGRAVVYLVPGTSYKFVLTTAAGVVVWTQDHVTAGPFFNGTDVAGTAGEALAAGKVVYLSDGAGAKTAGRWYLADNTNGYSSTLPTIGMVQIAIGSGSVGVVRTAGSITGLAGLVVGTTYYVGLAGLLTATPPANARVVGVADTTTSLVLNANPASLASNAPIVQTTALTGSQDNFALLPGVSLLRCTNATALFLTGMAAGIDGQEVTIVATNSDVRLTSQDTASLAANRFLTYVTPMGNQTPLAPASGTATVKYDATTARWRLIEHTQGASLTWIPTDASGAGLALTVVTAFYFVVGRLVYVEAQVVYPATANGANAKIGGLPYQAVGRCALAIANCPVDIRASITGAQVIDLLSNIGVAKTNAQMTTAALYFSGWYFIP